MKAAQNKSQSPWARWNWRAIKFVAVAVFVATFNSACGNKGGGTAPVQGGLWYPGAVPNCATCPGVGGNAGFLANAVARQGSSSYGQPIEMDLDFFGDAAQMQNYQMYQQQGYFYGQPSATYYGPFSAGGMMFIPYPLNECGVPPGQYQLQTVYPGVWGNDGAGRSGEGIRMRMGNFPGEVVMSGYLQPVTPPVRGRDGRTYPYQFVAQVRIMGAQGYMPCDIILY